MKQGLCSFTDCGGFHDGNNFKLCRKHLDMLKFFVWAMNHVKVKEEGKTDSGLYLPK